MLILDGFTMQQLNDFHENQSVKYLNSGFWSEQPHICITNNYLYRDTLNYLEQYVIITHDNSECYNIWNQVFSVDSLSEELKMAGFDNLRFFDDVCGKPFSSSASTICVVAK